jgi:hypothetical protein
MLVGIIIFHKQRIGARAGAPIGNKNARKIGRFSPEEIPNPVDCAFSALILRLIPRRFASVDRVIRVAEQPLAQREHPGNYRDECACSNNKEEKIKQAYVHGGSLAGSSRNLHHGVAPARASNVADIEIRPRRLTSAGGFLIRMDPQQGVQSPGLHIARERLRSLA